MSKYFLLILSFISLLSQAQNSRIWQSDFLAFADGIYQDTTDELREEKALRFQHLLDSLLTDPESFKYSFDSLKNLSVMQPKDDRFRLYTFCRPKLDGSTAFYGFVQVKPKRGEPFHMILEEKQASPMEVLNKELEIDEWYGALYYDIIMTKKRRKRYYTLLGWRGQDAMETQKILEIINISRNDEVTFGSKMIEVDPKQKPQHRYIMRYNAEVFATMRHEKRPERILMDHLVPRDENMEGIYQFYGPDLSYDAFTFKKGKWILEKDVDARNRRD